MDITTALKLIDLGFTTEQIKNLETPAAENTTPVAVTTPVVEASPVVPDPEVNINKPEPIDYKKLAEEVALYNQRNTIVQPEIKKEESTVSIPVSDPKTEAANAILGFLG